MTVLGAALVAAVLATGDDPCGVVLTEVAEAGGVVFVHDPGGRGDKHLPETMGAGVAWLDFDGDGWVDLYTVQSGPYPPSAGGDDPGDRLWRNLGGGRFEDWTARAGLGSRGYGQGVLAADLSGDGFPDLYVTQIGPDLYYENRGDGTFEDRTAEHGLGLGGWSSSAAAADADRDGDLDLYVSRYLVYDPTAEIYCGDLEAGERKYCDPTLFDNESDRFYLQDDDGRFVESTVAAGLETIPGKSLGVFFADLDGDHLPDLYVANDLTPNFVFKSRGDGTFEDLSLLSGAAANREGLFEAGMGVSLGDVDGDGDPDVAVSNFDVETNTLYENLGDLQFEDVSAARGFGVPSFNLLGFGIVLADLDRDADLDVYVTNGHIFDQPNRENVTYAQPDLVLLGDGHGGFREASCAFLAERPLVGRGLAAADWDRDGDVDLALLNSDGPLQLWRNDTPGGGWLGVSLAGKGENTEAVGAVVDLVDDRGRRQRRWVLAGDSYQSSSERRLLFGLGDASPAALEVTWPSGAKRRVVGMPAGRHILLTEAP